MKKNGIRRRNGWKDVFVGVSNKHHGLWNKSTNWTKRTVSTTTTTEEKNQEEEEMTRLRIPVQKKNVPGSTKKNNRIAQLIRGMYAEDALAQLYFTKKRRKDAFIQVIKRGVNRAELEHGIPQSRLRIAHVNVTKGQMLKRPRFHARGRTGKNYHRFSHITMTLEETEELPPLGQRKEVRSNWRSKWKGGNIPKDVAEFPNELLFPYRYRIPAFTDKSV